MDKTKRALIILVAVFSVGVISLFGVMLVRNRNSANLKKNQPPGLPLTALVQKRASNDALTQEIMGRITAIEGNNLTVTNGGGPLTPLTKGEAGVALSLKTSTATAVFFVEKDGVQTKRQLVDIRVGDKVKLGYNKLTKEIKTVYVSIGGAELVLENN